MKLFDAGDMAKGEASDRAGRRTWRVDRMRSRSIEDHQCTCIKIKSYNGRDSLWRGASRSSDRDPMATKRSVFKCISSGSIRSVHS